MVVNYCTICKYYQNMVSLQKLLHDMANLHNIHRELHKLTLKGMRDFMERTDEIKNQIQNNIIDQTLWFMHLKWLDVMTIAIVGYACFVDGLRSYTMIILVMVYLIISIYVTALQWRYYQLRCICSYIIPQIIKIMDGKYQRLGLPTGFRELSKMEKLFENVYDMIYVQGDGVEYIKEMNVVNTDIKNIIVEYLWHDIGVDEYSLTDSADKFCLKVL